MSKLILNPEFNLYERNEKGGKPKMTQRWDWAKCKPLLFGMFLTELYGYLTWAFGK